MNDIENIQLSAVKLEDNTYRITTKAKVDDLAASIQQIGLIHPPLIKQTTSAGYVIISGFRRIAACMYLGWKEIPTRVLDADIDDARCVSYAIVDNALQRPLNLIEISRSIALLSTVITDDDALAETASKLGLPADPGLNRKIKKICDLATPIQDGILANTISLAMALELAKFDANIGVAFAKIFAQLKIGLNKQRELIVLLDEIAHRENTTIENLLNEKDIRQILDDDNLDRAQQRQRIREYLTQRRFPTISRTQHEFKRQIKNLELDHRMALVPPKDFEGSSYTLRLSFSSVSELEELQGKLDRIIQSEGLAKFLSK